MHQTFLIAGLACLIGAVVGGGLKAFGIEIPLVNSRFRQVLLGLLGLILIAAGTIRLPSPGPSPPSPPVPHSGGTINVDCTANPHAIPAGGEVQIKVMAFTEQNAPVANANVRIESGGGWFSASGTTTDVGKTDANGVFTTGWRSPKPGPAAYGMNVSVIKEGFTEGKAECNIPIE